MAGTFSLLLFAFLLSQLPWLLEDSIIQFSSVAQSCLTLCNPMNWSTPGLPVHHHLPEFTQTHVHQVGDAIQPSHPLSSPFPPAPNPSQHLKMLSKTFIIRVDYCYFSIIYSLSNTYFSESFLNCQALLGLRDIELDKDEEMILALKDLLV